MHQRGGYAPIMLTGIPQVRSVKELRDKIQEAFDKLICVSFIASWCEPCREVSSRFTEIMVSRDQVYFILIDVDDCGGLQAMFNVTMVPTFILIQDANIIEAFVGSKFSRLVRRIDLYQESDGERREELERTAERFMDEVYLVSLTLLTERFPVAIKQMGLNCPRRGIVYKEGSKKFIEAYGEAIRTGMEIDDDSGSYESDPSIEVLHDKTWFDTPRKELPGEDTDHPESSKGQRHVQISERPFLTESEKQFLPARERRALEESERRALLEREHYDWSQESPPSGKKTGIRWLDIEDRPYSPDEVRKLLQECQLTCQIDEKKRERKARYYKEQSTSSESESSSSTSEERNRRYRSYYGNRESDIEYMRRRSLFDEDESSSRDDGSYKREGESLLREGESSQWEDVSSSPREGEISSSLTSQSSGRRRRKV